MVARACPSICRAYNRIPAIIRVAFCDRLALMPTDAKSTLFVIFRRTYVAVDVGNAKKTGYSKVRATGFDDLGYAALRHSRACCGASCVVLARRIPFDHTLRLHCRLLVVKVLMRDTQSELLHLAYNLSVMVQELRLNTSTR